MVSRQTLERACNTLGFELLHFHPSPSCFGAPWRHSPRCIRNAVAPEAKHEIKDKILAPRLSSWMLTSFPTRENQKNGVQRRKQQKNMTHKVVWSPKNLIRKITRTFSQEREFARIPKRAIGKLVGSFLLIFTWMVMRRGNFNIC